MSTLTIDEKRNLQTEKLVEFIEQMAVELVDNFYLGVGDPTDWSFENSYDKFDGLSDTWDKIESGWEDEIPASEMKQRCARMALEALRVLARYEVDFQ